MEIGKEESNVPVSYTHLLRRHLAASAAFSAGGADGQWKSKRGFGGADNPKCFCIRHIHGQSGGAERAGFIDGMKKLTRTFAKETMVFVVAEVGTDGWFHSFCQILRIFSGKRGLVVF